MITADELSLRKLPPQALQAEQAVLAAILLANPAINRAVELLKPDDFYKESHRKIFSVMLDLNARNEAIDLITLTDALRAKDQLEAVGGASYLAELLNSVPTAANVQFHAGIVHEKSLLRSLINISTDIATQCYDAQQKADVLLDTAEQKIFAISDTRNKSGFVPMKTLVRSGFEMIERLAEKKMTGLPTHFADLDDLTSGLQDSDLIIVAGRPSMGKTAFALGLAQNVAIQQQKTVGIFSLEMSKEQLVFRMLCSEARVDAHKIRTGYIGRPGNDNWKALIHAAGRLNDAPIFIDDSASISIFEMRAKARRLKSEHALGLIIVDYLQLMQGHGGAANREREIADISRSLKGLAKELHLPVIALSQLSRAVEGRDKKRPILADLRECVTGNTLVSLADGRRVPIRDLVGQAPWVWSVDDAGKIVAKECAAIWPVGTKKVFEIFLASGRTLKVTEKHRLLTGVGWKELQEIQVHDRLAIARRIPEPQSPKVWAEARLILLAHLIGDGSYLKGQPLRYTTLSEDNSLAITQAAKSEFKVSVNRHSGKYTWHQLVFSGNGNRWHPAGINAWLRALGIFDQRSHEKRVPGEIFQLSNLQIAQFLKHLWATDGTIFTRQEGQKGSHVIHYSTNSPGLAWDVAFLLQRLSIHTRIQKAQKKDYRPGYGVCITGAEMQMEFLNQVGGFGPRAEQAIRLKNRLANVIGNTNVDTLPLEVFQCVKEKMREKGISQREMAALRGTSYGGTSHFKFAPSRRTLATYADLLEDADLKRECESDLFWDRVVAIQEAGEEEVYDLTVPGTQSWLADSIVSHNSGAIEQDADVVLFIYRQEVYDPCKCPQECLCGRRGVAEIIIGKQRNGPIGSAQLAFSHSHTRFDDLARDHPARHAMG